MVSLHLFMFLSVRPVMWNPSPSSPATQLPLGLGTGAMGNFFAGNGARGLTFHNYPLLHLLVDYLMCLVEKLHLSGVSEMIQTACWSLWWGCLGVNPSLGHYAPISIRVRTELVSSDIKLGCRLLLEIKYGKELYSSMTSWCCWVLFTLLLLLHL